MQSTTRMHNTLMLRGFGGMPSRKILKIRYSEIAFGSILEKKIALHAHIHFKLIALTYAAGYNNIRSYSSYDITIALLVHYHIRLGSS